MTSADILLVEDNEDDVLLTLTALKRLGFGDKTAVCRDGVDALEYLFREGSHAQRDGLTQPKLVLLDIKLPKIDGIEVVRRLKRDTRTKSISVVMLTSSSRQADISAASQAGADHYLTKSVDFGRFSQEIAQISRQFLGA